MRRKTRGNGRFGRQSRLNSDKGDTKTDNSALELKTRVREWVVERLGMADADLAVLDLYSGQHGEMYQVVWHRAGYYLGVDKNHPHKLARTIKASAELVVQQLDLAPFNVYDLDCYGEPWIVARRLLRKRSPGRFGLILTEGAARDLKSLTVSEIIRATIGMGGLQDSGLLIRYQDMVEGLMLRSLGELPGVALVSCLRGQLRKQNTMYYYGLIVDKAPQ